MRCIIQFTAAFNPQNCSLTGKGGTVSKFTFALRVQGRSQVCLRNISNFEIVLLFDSVFEAVAKKTNIIPLSC